jgi:alkanesulfonate monooxygenase
MTVEFISAVNVNPSEGRPRRPAADLGDVPAGASTALVGTPETVAAAILDYVDLGADLISIRDYDNLNDLIDYCRYILPLVRQELAHRADTGERGTLRADDLDALA